jgi:hypothetical protein
MILWFFLKAIFKRWWTLMSSAIFTLIGLYSLYEDKSNAWLTRTTFIAALICVLVGSFLAWSDEYAKTNVLLSEKKEIEQKYLDESPQLGLTLIAPSGQKAWGESRNNPSQQAVFFSLHHLSGRIPTSIRFDPVISLGGHYSLHFMERPFVSPPVKTPLTFEIRKEGNLPDPQTLAEGGWTGMMLEFVWDSPNDLPEFRHKITVQFEDRGEERSQSFPMIFSAAEYRFTKP